MGRGWHIYCNIVTLLIIGAGLRFASAHIGSLDLFNGHCFLASEPTIILPRMPGHSMFSNMK